MREDSKKFDMLYYTMKTHVDAAMLFRDIAVALKVLKGMKNTCDDYFKLKHKMFVYGQLGYCHRVTSNYGKAVKCFKKMLQIAYYTNDVTNELVAYDNLAIDTFYLGHIDKSNYYKERVIRGKTENQLSITKRVACQIL